MIIYKQPFSAFKIGDLFVVSGCSKKFTSEALAVLGDGIYPYITTSAANNGISGYASSATEKGNVITVDSATVGSAFYQRNAFNGSDHVEKLVPKCGPSGAYFVMNEQIGLFICSLLKQEMFRYSYGRKYNQTRIRNTKIFLPLKPGADIADLGPRDVDWDWVTSYMTGLMDECQVAIATKLQNLFPTSTDTRSSTPPKATSGLPGP